MTLIKTVNLMEQNNYIELDPKVQKEIEKKVADLKESKKLRIVFPIVVFGDPDYDEKEVYVGYFQQPPFTIFSKYITLSQKDQAQAMRQLAKDCFLEGDRELVDDDSLFLYGLMGQLSKIIEMRNGQLVNLSKAGK